MKQAYTTNKQRGKIILLNGVSSSGKTTFGNKLKQLLNQEDCNHPYKFFQLRTLLADSFENYFYKHYKQEFQAIWADFLRTTFLVNVNNAKLNPSKKNISAEMANTLNKIKSKIQETFNHVFNKQIYKDITSRSNQGENSIVEIICAYPEILENIVEKLKGYPVVLIKIVCPIEKAKQNERARGNRPIGFTEQLFETIHTYYGTNKIYDFEIGPFDFDFKNMDAWVEKTKEFLNSNTICVALEENRELVQQHCLHNSINKEMLF